MAFTPEERQEIRDIMKSQSRDVSTAPIVTDVDGATSLPIVTSQNKVARVTIDQLRQGINVQSDWAENDPTSPAYIRNRTHYRGGDTTSWNGTASLTGGYGWCQGNINITTGARYDVVFTVSGGSTFVYRGLRPRTDDDGNFYLSKDWIITASPMSADGEDAWYVWNVDGTVYLGVSFLQNVEIEVSVTNADVKTLDEQYVPDSIPMKISQQELTVIINS